MCTYFSQVEKQTPFPDNQVYYRTNVKNSLVPRNRFIQPKWGKELMGRKRLGCSWTWEIRQKCVCVGGVGRVLQQWHLPSRVDSSFPGGSLGHCYLSFLLFPGWLISCSRDLVQILKELISLIGFIIIPLLGRDPHGSSARLRGEFGTHTVYSMTMPHAPPGSNNNLDLLSWTPQLWDVEGNRSPVHHILGSCKRDSPPSS